MTKKNDLFNHLLNLPSDALKGKKGRIEADDFPEGYDENLEMTRDEFEKLFHIRGKRTIFTTPEGNKVKVGDWLYVAPLDPKHRNESEPDIIEGFYKTYYGTTFVVVRIGAKGKAMGQRKTYELENLKKLIHTGEITLLRMPLFSYGDRFTNKFNKEELIIRDVPRSLNDLDDDFIYYVRIYSFKEGRNYRAISETEIREFYHTEGVIKRWEGKRNWT